MLSLTTLYPSPECGKEVLNSVLEHSNADHNEGVVVPKKPVAALRSPIPAPSQKPFGRKQNPLLLKSYPTEEELEINEEDIAVFKRVVQHIIHLGQSTSITGPLGPIAAETNEASKALFDVQSEMDDTESDVIDLAYHPLVIQYISKCEDVRIKEESLDCQYELWIGLPENQEAKVQVDLTLGPTDEALLGPAGETIGQLKEEIAILKDELEELKQECIEMGLMDEYGKPNSFQAQEQSYFEGEVDINTQDHQSDYVKYPLLLPSAGTRNQVFWEASVRSEEILGKVDRINNWMLHKLRSSPLDVNLLARTFEEVAGKKSDGLDWESNVLKFWHKDEAENKVKAVLGDGISMPDLSVSDRYGWLEGRWRQTYPPVG